MHREGLNTQEFYELDNMNYIIIDYIMTKAVSSRISARPGCILRRVMGLVSSLGPTVLGRYKPHDLVLIQSRL